MSNLFNAVVGRIGRLPSANDRLQYAEPGSKRKVNIQLATVLPVFDSVDSAVETVRNHGAKFTATGQSLGFLTARRGTSDAVMGDEPANIVEALAYGDSGLLTADETADDSK